MANNKEPTTKWHVDISELNKGMQDAQRQIRLANAEFKAASSGMDNWSTSADGITAKLKQLKSTLDAQKTVLNLLSRQYAEVVHEQGEGSRAAQELAIKIHNQRAAINDTNRAISQYERSLSEIESESNQAESSSEDLAHDIENAGESAKKAESGFTVLKGALANLVAEGIKTVISGLKDLTAELINDSSNAYAQFAAATGTATEAMGEYEEAIKNVYKNNFGESLEDVAEKMAKVKEITGELDASKLQEMTEKAITLEDTFGMDMVETLRGVQSLMNHFGLTSEQAFDLMSSGAQNGLNYTDELGDNVAEYAGKFAEAGYSSEEYFQLLKNGADGGAYNLDKVNDAVNEVTTRMADGTISDSLGSFSKGTQDIFKSWQNGGATQKEVIESIVKDIQTTTGEQEKMNLAALAFGTMAEDGGTKFIEALTPVGNTFDSVKGKANELASVKYDTPQAALAGIGRTLKTDLLGPLADKLTPTLNNLAAWVTANLPEFIEKVKELASKGKEVVTELEKWTPLIAGIGAAMATYFVVTQIAAFVGWIKSGAAAIKAMEIAQAALNVAMRMNLIGIIIALIAGLVVAFVTLWNKSEEFRNFWIGLWEKIKEAVSGFIDFFKNLPESVRTWFDSTVEKAKEFGKSMKEKAVDTGKKFLSSIINFIQNLPSKIGYYLGYALGKVITWAANMQKKAAETGSKFINAVIEYIQKLPERTWNWLLKAIAKVENFKNDITKKAKEAGKEFIGKVIEYLANLPQKTKEKFDKTVEKAKEFVTNLGTKGKEAGSELLEKVKEGVKDLPSKMGEIGKNIVEGVWKGIVNAKDKFVQDVKSFFGGIVTGAKDALDINSPSRVMRDQIGKNIVLGVAEGIKKNKDYVKQAMQDLTDDIANPLNLDVSAAKTRVISSNSGKFGVNGNQEGNVINNDYTFNQYNNSPKALSRLEIYRQTNNQLKLARRV